MSKDLLDEATRALRETEPLNEFEARATRARVMSGLHQTRVRRRTRLAFLLPLAASFVAVSAWGAASGKARLVLDKLEQLVGVTVDTPSSAPPTPKRPAAPRPAVAPSPEPELPPAPVTASPAAEPLAVPSMAVRSKAPGGNASSEHADGVDPALALYRVAHTAHFVDRDPGRALAAWDAYLRAAPKGEFAPEARYNRALSLVRLGRNEEARNALEPFANGAYGGYRKAEASALLERIAAP
ncbi:MAG TPA: hypothetical protein VGC79_24825 [Polyangiaceae bacterium]